MEFAAILFILYLIFFLVLILLFLAGFFRPSPNADQFLQEILNTISLQQGFCDLVGCDGNPVEGERGKCELYQTFSTDLSVVDKLKPLGEVPANPAANSEFCDDGFVKALQKFERTCMADNCLGFDGTIYTRGQVEKYYKVCRKLPACSNSRSAIIFNFFVNDQNKIATNRVRCLSASNQDNMINFDAVICPQQVTLESNVFLDIDNMPVVINRRPVTGAEYIRIRAPGSADCLSVETTANQPSRLIVSPCQQQANEGFTWLLTPPLTITDQRGLSLRTYPSQIIQRPTNIETINFSNPLSAAISLSVYPALQLNAQNQLVLGTLGCCSDQSGSICSAPLGAGCPYPTAIISAYSWQELFG